MKKLCDVLNVVEYIAFMVATALVLVFQFNGLPVFVTVALVVYVIGFGIICAIGVMQTVDIFRAAKQTDNVVVTNKNGESEQVNIKYEKSMKILKTVLAGLFTIFTLIVLILY